MSEEAVVVNGVELFDGDYVKVLHAEGRRDGFIGHLRGIRYDDEGNPVSVDAWGGKKGYEKMRTIPIERVKLLSTRTQNRLQRDDEARRDQGLAPKYKRYSDVQ